MLQHPVRRSIGAGLIGLSAFALAACGGKPSEAEIKDKLVDLYGASSSSMKLPKDRANKIADCLAPKLHDTMSEDGLDALMDVEPKNVNNGKVPDVSKSDEDAFTKAVQDCSSTIMGG